MEATGQRVYLEQPHPSPAMADHAAILAILQFIGTAATAVCDEFDKAFNLDLEVGHALKGLRKGVESLKSDTMVYKALLSAMEIGAYLDESSPYTRFTQLYVTGVALKPYAHRANRL